MKELPPEEHTGDRFPVNSSMGTVERAHPHIQL
jgi:hypothetical protein